MIKNFVASMALVVLAAQAETTETAYDTAQELISYLHERACMNAVEATDDTVSSTTGTWSLVRVAGTATD